MYDEYNSHRREMSDAYRKVRKRNARRRKKQKMIKMATTAFVVTAVSIGAIFAANKGLSKDLPDTQRAVGVVSANEQQTEQETSAQQVKRSVIYPSISSSYVNIVSSQVKSEYVALLDVDNNQVIAGKKCNEKMFPASMTKVMTLIVAVENIKDMNDTFTMTAKIIDPLVRENASRAGFDPNEVVSAKDLLYGLILPSGADAADGLAEMLFGSQEAFVQKMNEKCVEMGLKNTHFANTSGLHDKNQYTTAVEMAMIFEYAMEDETCAEILSTYQYTTAATTQHPKGIDLTSTMFSRMYGDEAEGVLITAGKTGYTIEAGNCLVSFAEKGNTHYIAVTAGATNKWHVIYDDFEIYAKYANTQLSNLAYGN